MPHSYYISEKTSHQQLININNPRLADLPLLSIEQYEKIIIKRPTMIDGIAKMLNLAMVHQKSNTDRSNNNLVSGGNTAQ
ncbi:hypothetical protein [Xenorhabdus innexi]|uniref:Uncharacterized protein n=1 Tax=Xenorhabdus innexi TaxID=290109 RepID=A0A1N6N0U7_9GAMM|nr:hypothetical protein [Xenorhabdus innexi]PHM28333.1 hypothetical protein Xinn_03838 [Xenorhabdus innexi]SIP74690.1 hypothetical protein XIS1_790002 [Xenorhabdus innexi]